MIYYLCPDMNHPSGGIRVIYRHVDRLNQLGLPAAVLHCRRGYRCSWFENRTTVEYIPDVRLGSADFLVVPEVYAGLYLVKSRLKKDQKLILKLIRSAVNKVIFNQNAYNTFRSYPLDGASPDEDLYHDPQVRACMVVSEDNREYLEMAFDHLPVSRIHNSIDPAVFSYDADKKEQIAYMPRRNPEDARQVINIIRNRGWFAKYRLVAIENMSEAEVAGTLKESKIFLSFGYPEGFGLPPAEAMACGCMVVGYHGWGGKEYFRDDFFYPVAHGDIAGFVRRFEFMADTLREDPERVQQHAIAGSQFILEQYSPAKEDGDLESFWKSLKG